MKEYAISPNVLIRTPRRSFNELKAYGLSDIELLLNRPAVQEALRIASSDLYEKLQKYSRLEPKEKERARNSFIRYMNRMSTRCVPFGLFAGCSLGKIDKDSNLLLSQKITRHTRLDMSYLCSLARYLSEIPEIKCKLKYHPNTSLYKIGDEYRYIEYHYSEDKRIHKISSVRKTFYLKEILQCLKKEGACIDELYPLLTNEYISREQAAGYMDSLIQSQIIVSELDPAVTGEDLLNQLITILYRIDPTSRYYTLLKSIQDLMTELDSNDLNCISKYEEIEDYISQIGAPYNKKYLFQVDMNTVFINHTITSSLEKEILSTLQFLNKITPTHTPDTISRFKEEFVKRFGEREIPLLTALDPETGIGYPVGNRSHETSPLLDDLIFPDDTDKSQNARLNKIQAVLLEKMNGPNRFVEEIEITDEDFAGVQAHWDDLPDTFSVFFEIIKNQGAEILIRLESVGNSSAANLLARFAYTDAAIDHFVKEITTREQSLNPSSILAEVAHLPDSRLGNVLHRPHLREYEITYLAHNTLPPKQWIYGSDLWISVQSDRICLRSKRLNKEIIPRLTTAHNHQLSTIPFYRFLCDLQYVNKRSALNFPLDPLKNEVAYLPRIRYKHTLLSPARWNIEVSKIAPFFSIKEDPALLRQTELWRKENRIPDHTLFLYMERTLFVDWTNALSLRAFFSFIKNLPAVHLIEFLYDEKDAVVRDEQGNGYLNECIVTLIKNERT